MVGKWRVFYGDGSTYSDEDGDAWHAPVQNVQVIIVPDPDHGWEVVTSLYGGDGYYLYIPEEDTWRLSDHFGMWDYLTLPGPKRVLLGRTLSKPEYQAVLKRAQQEAGPKTGRWPHERKS